MSTLRDVIRDSKLDGFLDPTEIDVHELPDIPSGIFEEDEAALTEQNVETVQTEQRDNTESSEEQEIQSEKEIVERLKAETESKKTQIESDVKRLSTEEGALEDMYRSLRHKHRNRESGSSIFDIPGIGRVRGHKMISAGIDSVDELAASRPIDVAEKTYMSENMATMVIEGARELVGAEESTPKQLAHQTTKPVDECESAINQLAAAGVPPPAAKPTLREIYSQPITAVDGVDGRMAYFLHEAGYTTPWELTQATAEELQEIDYLGPTTAEQVIETANEFITQS